MFRPQIEFCFFIFANVLRFIHLLSFFLRKYKYDRLMPLKSYFCLNLSLTTHRKMLQFTFFLARNIRKEYFYQHVCQRSKEIKCLENYKFCGKTKAEKKFFFFLYFHSSSTHLSRQNNS